MLIDLQIISTHTPLAGRDAHVNERVGFSDISTHTPLAGRDNLLPVCKSCHNISTHTPLAGRDRPATDHLNGSEYFYSHAPRGA